MLHRFFQKSNWAFWVLMLGLLTFTASWKFWFVIGWQMAHPKATSPGAVPMDPPFPWLRVNQGRPAEFDRFRSMSPLWGDGFSTAIVGLPSLADTQLTDEAWMDWSKRTVTRKGEAAQMMKLAPNMVCVRSSGSEIEMLCRSKEGPVLRYRGPAKQAAEAIGILLKAIAAPNL